MRRHCCCLPIVLVVAAGSWWTMGAMANASADDNDRVGEKVEYFLGESTVTGPDGTVYGSLASLVKRATKPAEKVIEEEVLVLDPRDDPADPPKTFSAVLKVDGSSFKAEEKNGAFTGEGTLKGEAWNWTGWSSTSTLPDGMKIQSEDTRTESGLTAKKTVHDAEGNLRVYINEKYNAISKELYEILHSRLASRASK